MIVLLAELFLDGRLATRPDRAPFLAETFDRDRGAGRPAVLWTPWSLPERVGGLRARKIPADRLPQLLARISRKFRIRGAAKRHGCEAGRPLCQPQEKACEKCGPEPGLSDILLLGDAGWNRVALESGRVEEVRIRWRAEFGFGGAHSFVSGFQPREGARLRLRLMRWRRAGAGGIVARYAVGREASGSPA